MTILITADLHLDLWADAGRDPFAGIVPVLRDLDALIIAGDLANDPQRNWPWALARIARLVSPAKIWVIPGNHDYYGATLDDDILARITAEAGANLAQKQVLTFGNCRLLCCTLWTDFALLGDPGTAMVRAAMAMLDYTPDPPGGGQAYLPRGYRRDLLRSSRLADARDRQTRERTSTR